MGRRKTRKTTRSRIHCTEAILLAGGWGTRLKPHTDTPKPLLKLGESTLIDRQIQWLRKNGIDKIIIPYANQKITELDVIWIKENRMGTGGASLLGCKEVTGEYVYIMNVDDIVSYNPNDLVQEAHKGVSILVTHPRLPYGKITLDDSNNIAFFEEKPRLVDCWVSCGHYCIRKDLITKYFPKKGNLEDELWSLVKEDKVKALPIWDLEWVTINTMKDYSAAKKHFQK